MAGSGKHPQFIFPSIQLLVSPVQFGFVVVVMMLGPKAKSVMPKVHLPVEGLSHSSLGFHFPVVRLACLFTQKNSQDSWGSQTAVLLTRNLGCSCDCHRPPAVLCHDNCELKDGRSGLKNERGRKEIGTLWFLLNMKCSFRKFLLWLKAWGIHCCPRESSYWRVASGIRNKLSFSSYCEDAGSHQRGHFEFLPLQHATVQRKPGNLSCQSSQH